VARKADVEPSPRTAFERHVDRQRAITVAVRWFILKAVDMVLGDLGAESRDRRGVRAEDRLAEEVTR
jgi:hypothetical protein